MKQNKYKETVNLLLEILPFVLQDERMALKGGTAINLFHRNFPRLSVDIDLCYLPLEDRTTTFNNIHHILTIVKKSLEQNLGLIVNTNNPLNGKKEAKLVASKNNIQIKIEPNFILRSSLFPPEIVELSQKASNEFQKSIQARCLNIADTYGGKICAALDRQHPRDFFDIKFLLENEGITKDIKDSFIFYLISHNRPINELLNPHLKDINREYNDEFRDMTQEVVTLNELIATREKLLKTLKQSISDSDKNFLISFIENNPDWSLVKNSKIKDFPSVQWKIYNQRKMNSKKRDEYIKKLKSFFLK